MQATGPDVMEITREKTEDAGGVWCEAGRGSFANNCLSAAAA